MASLLFISLYDEFNLGVRQLVSILRAANHDAQALFLKRFSKKLLDEAEKPYPYWQVEIDPSGKRRIAGFPVPLSQTERKLVLDLVRRMSPQFIGLSVYSAFVPQAIELTAFLRDHFPRILIGWGGPHVTCDPTSVTDFCDLAFVGECDYAILELAQCLDKGTDWRSLPNIVWKEQGETHTRPLTPLVEDLDSLPFTYFGSDGVYYIESDELLNGIPFPDSGLKTYHKILTARGCPYTCSFCMVANQKKNALNYRVRFRSIENCIRELEETKRRMGHFYLEIEDDIFTVKPDRMREFFEQYSKKIRMPFWCYTHPNYARPDALQLLKDNNVEFVVMGIQSGSERIALDVFDRRVKNATIIEAAKNIHAAGIRVFYDIITNNPFEEEEDRRQTFELLRQLPKPFGLQMGALVFYPNLPVTLKRDQLGLPQTVDYQQYRFWNALYFLASFVEFSAEEAAQLLADPTLRNNPRLLEAIAEVGVSLVRENGDLKALVSNHLREVHRLASLLRSTEERLSSITCRRGFKQFIWFSDILRKFKRALMGEIHRLLDLLH